MATAMGTGAGTLHYRATHNITFHCREAQAGRDQRTGARAEIATLGKQLAVLYPQ
jgi:hypothetical protein